MRRQRWWLPLLALVLMTNWKPTLTLPVPDDELDTSTKLLGSSVVTSVSVVTGSSENGAGSVLSNADRSRVIPSKELPGSPADLLRPDKFQFYTLNKDGDVVTKQMTKQEIQTLIAAGGGHLPMEIYEPQTAGDVPTGGMKVADVVQNVQNVLKGELSKPATVMTSMPTIPGHANTEWSSILPAILGGESESAPASDPSSATYADIGDTSVVADTTLIKIPDSPGTETAATKLPAEEPSTTADYETKKTPTGMTEMEPHTEKPMIQVPVITVDQKLSAHQDEEDSMPVFQMLNTISADKINASNKTQVNDKPEAIEPQKVELLGQEEIARPEKVTIKPIVQVSAVEQFPSANKEVPEMVKINLNLKKPTEKPDSMVITTGIISKVPQVEPPASVSVISETHSTSMKVSGHEEVPLREPSKPEIKPDDLIKLPSKEKEPEVMEKPTTNPSTDAKLDLTTVKAEPMMTPPEVTATETMKKPGLIAQGVSFFGNLPQAVNTIVTGFISSNSPSSKPTVEEADAKVPPEAMENLDESLGTKDAVKKPQISETLASNAAFTPIREVATTKEPDQPPAPIDEEPATKEPIYQMMPEIIPNKKIPPQGASPAEASSIEHIIETLNDPTGSISGTVAADHFITQADSAEPSTVAVKQTSTAATPINVETPTEYSSAKPMEPLPTELADSLSSMISQISDAKPSVLPVSQNAGLDTTEKKNVVDMQAEEPGTDETTKTNTEEVSRIPEKPENETELPSQDETEKPTALSTKIPENQDPTTATASATEVTEKLTETSSTTYTPVTTETTNLDVLTTAKSDLPTHEVIPDVPLKKVDEIEVPVGEKLEVSLSNEEKLKPDVDPVVASSDIATDKVTPAVSTEASVTMTEATQSTIAEEQPVEKMSTEKPAATIANSADVTVTTVVLDGKETPPNVETNVLPTLEALKPDSQQNDTLMKDDVNENNTEMPIVHIDITEAKPTDNTNKSQVVENQNNGPESPFVRIQLTDPITLINNMIKTASVNTSAGALVPLSLPETGSVPPGSIASGLIAGFPSSTTQATLEAKPTPSNSVKSQPELQPVDNNSVTGTAVDLESSDVQGENITKIATTTIPEVTTMTSPTEKTEILETSTLEEGLTAEPEFTVQTIATPMEPIAADQPDKETTTQTDVTQQTSTDKPKKEDSIDTSTKSAEIEVSPTTMGTTTEASDENLTKVSDNVTVVLVESTTQLSTVSYDMKTSESTIHAQSESGDTVNEASKIVETTVSTSAKPEEVTTGTADSAETKIQDSTSTDPEKSTESTNSAMPEAPVVRIDVAPEKVLEDMPPKIQLTDLPIVETTMVPIKSMETEKVEIPDSQLATTTQIPIKVDLDDSLQTTTVSSTENIEMEINKDKPKLEDTVKEAAKTESSAISDASEKIAVTSTTILTPHQTEIRIQVNDTAVLVTKRPVSEISGQTPGDVQKTTVNQLTSEQPITPTIDLITEGPVTKLAENVERLPVPIKISELSSSHDTAPINFLTKTDTINSTGSETRIRLGEDKPNKESTVVKVEDPRKPIKKNSDSDSEQSAEETVTVVGPTSKIPPSVNDEISAHQDKDSNVEPSIKVELTTSATVDEPSTPLKISGSNKLEDKPVRLSDKKPPVRVTDKPSSKPGKPVHKPTMNIKKDDALPGPADEKWTLIPQQVYPALTKTGGIHTKRPSATEVPSTSVDQAEQKVSSSQRPPVSLDHPQSASGLDSTVKNLEIDISYFANLCNELAFTFWTATNKGLSTARSLAVSPFGMTSMLAMVFLGARGPTSDQMNDILKLDDVASFNPHLVFQNVTDAVGLARNQGIANAAFVRELFADRSKVRKLMPFYKEQAQQFYDGVVAEVNFATISDLVRRRTNLMIRKQTGGRIKDFVRTNTVPLRSPLAAMSANVFQTDCNSSAASSEGRDGELYFAVSPAVRQRKLVPVPATVWRAGVLAGYEPSLDATAIALGGIDKLVSTIFVIPGQQGHTAPGDTLDHLEQRFVRGATHDGAWNKLLKVLIPRPGLELQVPKFSHRSVINATAALKRMGLEELFSKHADLKGINGIATDLHLADVLQMNLFSTCGDENILSGRHHVEVYPGSPLRNAREQQESEEEKDDFLNDLADDEEAFTASTIPYESTPHRAGRSARQVEGTEKPRLKLDRPFLYFVRHNPTGLILHMGRFNPRLLP